MNHTDVLYREIEPKRLVPDERELAARLGGGCMILSADESLEELYEIMRPRYSAVRVPVSYEDSAVLIDGYRIESEGLMKNLSGAAEAYLIAVTLGTEVDTYLHRLGFLSGARRFAADAVASALAEALVCLADRELSCSLDCRPRFSPGYGDLPLSYQEVLLERVNGESLLGIRLTDTSFMLPSKSITAIMGIM
ncbi:MAG: hypothetical protein J6C39_01225 [Clostridia bacterium]|nr:hypothetical protein [Clostridia bacterium]MBO5206775.1 hypothetical protein [Clostridia bacterium]